ncbi:MAG: lipoate--protein ligase family protein [Planctomycetota bacterium]
MQNLQLTLDRVAENLALDEALLDAAEANEIKSDVLRLWELPTYCVVLGRSSSAEIEVDLASCREDAVPVLRRASGGGTIVAGPGCMMYTLVLSLNEDCESPPIDQTHRFVLEKVSAALTTSNFQVYPAGISDLAGRFAVTAPLQKFSGNAMRLKRRHLLYHGTLLYDFDLSRISRWLAKPTRVPQYRSERAHADFVTNLPFDRSVLTQRLLTCWQAEQPLTDWPRQATTKITNAKYGEGAPWAIHIPD